MRQLALWKNNELIAKVANQEHAIHTLSVPHAVKLLMCAYGKNPQQVSGRLTEHGAYRWKAA